MIKFMCEFVSGQPAREFGSYRVPIQLNAIGTNVAGTYVVHHLPQPIFTVLFTDC